MLIYNLLVSVILRKSSPPPADDHHSLSKGEVDPTGVCTPSDGEGVHLRKLATLYTAVHLLNPLVFTISTRGSSESVLASFVLLTLYFALKGKWDAAAVLLGVSTHWKLYPVIYGVGCLGVVGDDGQGKVDNGRSLGWKRIMRTVLNRRTLRFGVLSAGTFCCLGVLCYLM
jgi:GPI mannosyltransferase 1 subunit M